MSTNPVIEYHTDRSTSKTYKIEKWFEDGKLHRNDGPALIQYYPSGSVYLEEWHKNGPLHRENDSNNKSLPAWILYYEDGKVKFEHYYKEGKDHSEDGPAKIGYVYDKTKNLYYLETEGWYVNGMEHRENGPSSTIYKGNNQPKSQFWMQNGKFHNLKGPATKYYDREEDEQNEFLYHYANGKLRPTINETYGFGHVCDRHGKIRIRTNHYPLIFMDEYGNQDKKWDIFVENYLYIKELEKNQKMP